MTVDMKAVCDLYGGVAPTADEIGKKPANVAAAVVAYYKDNSWLFGPMGFSDWQQCKDYYARYGGTVAENYEEALAVWNAYNNAETVTSLPEPPAAPEYYEFSSWGSGWGEKKQVRSDDGFVVIDYYVYGTCADVWNSTYTMDVESKSFPIEKIEFVETSSSSLKSNPAGYESSTKTWTGAAQKVSFTASGDCEVYKMRVYLAAPSLIVESIYPEDNMMVESVKDFSVTFDDEIASIDGEATVSFNDAIYPLTASVADYSAKVVNFSLATALTETGVYTLNIPADFATSVNGLSSLAYTSTVVVPGTFGLVDGQQISWTGENIYKWPSVNIAEPLASVNGDAATGSMTFIHNAMKFRKDGAEVACPVGTVYMYPYAGDKTLYFTFGETCEEPGTYEFVFPAGLFVSQNHNKSEEFTLTFVVEKQLNYSNSRKAGDDFSIEVISMAFNHDITAVDLDGIVLKGGAEDIVPSDYTISGSVVEFTFDPAVTGATGYYLYIPAGNIDSDGVKNANAIQSSEYWLKALLAVSDAGWTTFCSTDNVKLPEGYTAYIVTGTEGDQVTLKALDPAVAETSVNFGNSNHDVVDGALTDGTVTVDLGGIYWGTGWNEFEHQGDATITISAPEGTYITGVEFNADGSYTNPTWPDGSHATSYVPAAWTNSIEVAMANFYEYVYFYGLTVKYTVPGTDVVIPAYAGVLIQGEAADKVAYETTYDAGSSVEGNLLRGTTYDTTWNEAGKTYYKFSLDADDTEGSAGFYYGVEGGASINAHAGKAYLVLDTPAASNVRYLINGLGETTGIDSVIAPEAAESIFNLQGQRVIAPAKGSVYVKSGKKVIVK